MLLRFQSSECTGQTHPAWQAWTGRFVPAALHCVFFYTGPYRNLLISPNWTRPLQTTAVGLSLKPTTTTPNSNFLSCMETVLCLFFLACWQIGGPLPLSTNQSTSKAHHELDRVTSAVERLKWEEFESFGFTAGHVSVSICVYVCMRDIFCIYQTEWIWSNSLLDWITDESETGYPLGFVTNGTYLQLLHFCQWFPATVPA